MYEIECKAAELKAKHETAASELKSQMARCKATLAVMPHGSIEERQQWQFMRQCLTELKQMLTEEQAAAKTAHIEAEKALQNGTP